MKKHLFLGFLICFALCLAKPAFANQFNFSVKPNLPENQIGQTGYYNLLMKSGQKQIVTVDLSNATDKMVTVEAAVASATTNSNGVVEYSPNAIKSDESLKYNLVDFVKLPKEISLAPKSTKNVEIQVEMPSNATSGTIAGGLTFKQKSSEIADKKDDKKQGLSIQNNYAYVVGFLMSQSETKIAPELNLTTVKAGQINYRNMILANLQNPKMAYLNQMQVEANVTGLTDASLSYTQNREMLQMAPNTNFDYGLPTGDGQKLQAGKYRLTMTVYGQKDPNGQYKAKDSSGKENNFLYRWQFTRDFEISGEQAKALNAKDVTIKKDNSWIWWLILAAILLILLLIFFFILWKRRKKDDDEVEENEAEKLLAEKLKNEN